ncbi:SWI/SNF-related matrix-associated actin-dependent regulator of chromatin subfamily A-like protein 1 [Lampetra fluviatilis]
MVPTGITEEQKRRMEENRRKALAKRAERLAAAGLGPPQAASGGPRASQGGQTGQGLVGTTGRVLEVRANQGVNGNPAQPPLNVGGSVGGSLGGSVGGSLGGSVGVSVGVSVGGSAAAERCGQSGPHESPGSNPQLLPGQGTGGFLPPSDVAKLWSNINSVKSGVSPMGTAAAVTTGSAAPGEATFGKKKTFQTPPLLDRKSLQCPADNGAASTPATRFYSASNARPGGEPRVPSAPAVTPPVSEPLGGGGSGSGPQRRNVVRGRCLELPNNRFKIEVGYKSELIALFKRVPSRLYDLEGKTWSFLLEDHDSLMSAAQHIPGVEICPLEGRECPGLQQQQPDGTPTGGGGGPSRGLGLPRTASTIMLVGHGWKKPPSMAVTARGRCVLVGRSRFEVDVTYHAEAIGIFKQIESRSYDAVTRKWNFLLEDYCELMPQLCRCAGLEVEPLPEALVRTFLPQFERSRASREPFRDIDLTAVGETLTGSLMPFQQEGVNFAIAQEGRVLIADDMGLGKTIQAICVAAFYRAEWPLLVVAPSSVRFTWAEAFRRWLPWLDPQQINVVVTGRDNPNSGLVNIISYDLLSRIQGKLEEKGFAVIIADESHFLKNVKTIRCKAALPLLKKARRVLLLSGTPAMSRPAELYTQVAAVQPQIFPKFHEFALRYCNAKQMPWGWDYTGSSNMAELRLLLEETVMIRRLKADVLSQLPAKQRKMVVVAPGVIDAKAKAALAAAAKAMDRAGKQSKTQEKEALMLFFSKTAEAKVSAIVEYVSDLLESGRAKFLVFAHHRVVLDALSAHLGKKGVGHIRIDGSTASAERQALCERFQRDDAIKVAVLSITAANMGITLSAADLVVFSELFWNPGVLIQAEDRVHRIGQLCCVNVHYLVARGTSDDYLWPIVQEKLRILGEAGLCGDSFKNTQSTAYSVKDPKQQSIMELLWLCGDEPDDAALAAAMDDHAKDGGCTATDAMATASTSESPSKKRKIEDWFQKK